MIGNVRARRRRGGPPPRRDRCGVGLAALVFLAAGAGGAAAQPGQPGFSLWPHLSQVRIVRQRARWEGLPRADPVDPFGHGGAGSMFVISGYVRNVGQQPIAYVKFAFELLDDDGRVVASEYGYNYRAEELRGPTFEEGWVHRGELDIEPILPGEADMFRMLFLRGEVPPFRTWRVRVLEVGYDREWTRLPARRRFSARG